MIRLALVGCGPWTPDYACVAARLQGASFSLAADLDPRRAEWGSHQLGLSTYVRDAQSLFAECQNQFDAVILRLPAARQAEYVTRAVDAGKHVLLELPWGLTLSEARALQPRCQRSGIRLMSGPVERYAPSLTTLRASLDTGQLGIPGLVRLHRWETVGDPTEPAATTQGSQERNEIRAANAVARDLALTHDIFRTMPTRIYAHGRSATASRPTCDYLQVHLAFPEGGMAMLDHTRDLPRGDGYFSMTLIGSRGAAYADDQRNHQLVFAGGHAASVPTDQGLLGLLGQLQEFVRAIEQGRDPHTSIETACQIMTMVDGVQRSIDAGTVCEWKGNAYAPS